MLRALNRQADQATGPTAAETELDRVRRLLAPPKLPPALVEADRALSRLRLRKDEFTRLGVELRQAQIKNPNAPRHPDLDTVEAELAKLSAEIATARSSRDAERERFKPEFMRQLGAGVAAYEAEVLQLLNQLQELALIAISARANAVGHGLETQNSLATAPALDTVIREARRTFT